MPEAELLCQSTHGPERSTHVLAVRVLSWGISAFHHESQMQVEAACRVPWLKEVILDFLEVHGLKEAVGLVKAAGKKCIVCTPRCESSETSLLSRLSKVQPRLKMQQFVYLPRTCSSHDKNNGRIQTLAQKSQHPNNGIPK